MTDTHEFWMHKAAEVAEKALCLKKRCGTVIVQGEEIIGEGYNAPPLDSIESRRCELPRPVGKPGFDYTCCVHAEWRAILDALRRNPEKIHGSTLYFTRVDSDGAILNSGEPFCTVCSRLALDVGITYFVLWHEDGIRSYLTQEYNDLSYEYVA